jgi:hypothetical protein
MFTLVVFFLKIEDFIFSFFLSFLLSLFLSFFFFLMGLGFEFRASHCKAGALPHKLHSSPFCSSYFEMGSWELFASADLKLQSPQSQLSK